MRFAMILALMLAPGAQAQLPRGFYPWWESPITRDLNLNEEQTRQIRMIVREHRSRLIDLRGTVEKAEGEVEDIFNEENFDQARASEAIDRLVASRSDLTRTFSQMSLKLRAILTPQQWRELQRRRPLPRTGVGPRGMGARPNRPNRETRN